VKPVDHQPQRPGRGDLNADREAPARALAGITARLLGWNQLLRGREGMACALLAGRVTARRGWPTTRPGLALVLSGATAIGGLLAWLPAGHGQEKPWEMVRSETIRLLPPLHAGPALLDRQRRGAGHQPPRYLSYNLYSTRGGHRRNAGYRCAIGLDAGAGCSVASWSRSAQRPVAATAYRIPLADHSAASGAAGFQGAREPPSIGINIDRRLPAFLSANGTLASILLATPPAASNEEEYGAWRREGYRVQGTDRRAWKRVFVVPTCVVSGPVSSLSEMRRGGAGGCWANKQADPGRI